MAPFLRHNTLSMRRWIGWLWIVLALALGPALVVGCASPVEADEPAPPPAPTPEEPTFREIEVSSHASSSLILMYHDVVLERGRGSVWYDVTLAELEGHIAKIREEGGEIVSLDALHAHLTQGAPIDERAVVLTFDDSYEGVYEHAWPLLRRERVPFTVYVHTAYIGNKTQGRPKMDAGQLREMVQSGLCTVASHTVTHPDDLTQKLSTIQREELRESKAVLEKLTGGPVRHLSYPNGKHNGTTMLIAKQEGYLTSVSMTPGMAQEADSVLSIPRYGFEKFEEAWDRREELLQKGPLGVSKLQFRLRPVSYRNVNSAGIELALVEGGMLSTQITLGRKPVSWFVSQANAAGGVNGSFFSMSAIASEDDTMVGPIIAGNRNRFMIDREDFRVSRLDYRPTVLWNDREIAFLPFLSNRMNKPQAFRQIIEDPTDLFVTGAWAVRKGRPLTREQHELFSYREAMDRRPRAFVGVHADGTPVIGATPGPCSSYALGQALWRIGVYEAVVLDSGYSTSLVYGDQVLAAGHRTRETASRPIPHAIVSLGPMDPVSLFRAVHAPNNERFNRSRR